LRFPFKSRIFARIFILRTHEIAKDISPQSHYSRQNDMACTKYYDYSYGAILGIGMCDSLVSILCPSFNVHQGVHERLR
jgi:hypothetical protein